MSSPFFLERGFEVADALLETQQKVGARINAEFVERQRLDTRVTMRVRRMMIVAGATLELGIALGTTKRYHSNFLFAFSRAAALGTPAMCLAHPALLAGTVCKPGL
jgi:hypothetical protein